MLKTLHEKLEVVQYRLKGSERFPNNLKLPLLIYKAYFDLGGEDGAGIIKDTFESNSWPASWVDGIYDYHHYHSTAHEVLGVATGKAVVNFGGTGGVITELNKGDVVIIPAGVAHKCLKHSSGFKCVGAYPIGQQYDMNTGMPGERLRAERNIQNLPLPETDPVLGPAGPLMKYWKTH